jgi:hypothetical protein
MKSGLIIGSFAALTLAAITGWSRDPQPTVPTAQTEIIGYNAAGEPVYSRPPVVPAAATPAVYYQPAPAPRTVAAAPRTVAAAPAPAVKKPRSTKKSVAIVAGSAGVGAAIGAIAGGGKGAAIGAISGGAGGFVYDRITHNK